MPAKLDINYVEFSSADIGASCSFFKNAFGWTFADYGPSYQAIENAGLDGGVEQANGAITAPLIVLYADDLDAAEAAVTAAGGEITRAQFDFPGGRRFHFREPGGNQLAVWSAAKAA
ncbi:VOC family protein [Pelagibacterium xiamenense]|uniref:VOC family protein n=1 Tax=Pelagibacterium xiamenense TaxID=2901140 RepID=UPI001E634713|nr:VOC family protein [Pelagibacterium xiamenense]MCD7061232.1 VOC family protein [Pelagibacterium xiamenense]